MKLNAMQTQVAAKLYEEGARGQVRSLEDVGICHDALFLFLLREAEICSDTGDLRAVLRSLLTGCRTCWRPWKPGQTPLRQVTRAMHPPMLGWPPLIM